MIRPILDLFFGRRLRRQTSTYISELVSGPERESHKQATAFLAGLGRTPGARVTIGTTSWGEEILMPIGDLINAHSIITGGTGSGKTRYALGLIKSLLDVMPEDPAKGFGVLDPKGDLFTGTLLLLSRRLAELDETNARLAEDLRRRVIIVDFASRDPVSPYNVLARWPSADPEFFASSRGDLLLDLLPGGDGLSLGASAVLRRIILLLSEFGLPITSLDDVLHDATFRDELVRQSKNESLRQYFARQFSTVPKQSVAALSRRMEALFSSESVRLSLSGTSAPDMRKLQDEGKIILVNCFGENLSRSVRELMQAMVLSDLAQSVFARQRKEVSFLWFCDEAQNFFASERLRDHMNDLLTMSRSFGTFVCCLTQNIGTAVHDERLLNSLFTNIRWSLSMRGEPSDCAFLKRALPVTGRKLEGHSDPFSLPTFYSENDERSIELNAIAHLPDRAGYFWFRPRMHEAVRITSAELVLPSGGGSDCALNALLKDVNMGMRMSRREFDRHRSAAQARSGQGQPNNTFELALAETYTRVRGGGG